MKRVIQCLTVVSMFAVCTVAFGVTGVALPYGSDFETNAVGDDLVNPWSVSSGTAKVVAAPTAPDGSQAVYSDDELTFTLLSGSVYSNVWWQCNADIVPQDGVVSDLAITEVAGFYLKSNGDVMAWDAAAWVLVKTGVDISGWGSFAVHLDYKTKLYDIYRNANGSAYNTDLVKLNTTPIAFNTAPTLDRFAGLTIEGSTYLDNVSIAKNQVTVADNVGEGAGSPSKDVFLKEGFTGFFASYFASADRKMSGPLGDALFTALAEGDKVFIRKSATQWYEIERPAPGSDWSFNTTHGDALSAIVIDATTAIYIEYGAVVGNRPPAVVGGFDAATPAVGVTLTTSALNLLAVPMDATLNLTITGGLTALGLPAPVVGDRLFISRINGANYDTLLCREPGTWIDLTGGPAEYTFTPGQVFWYYRHVTPGTWDVDGGSGVY